jgi:hypothetical protein
MMPPSPIPDPGAGSGLVVEMMLDVGYWMDVGCSMLDIGWVWDGGCGDGFLYDWGEGLDTGN